MDKSVVLIGFMGAGKTSVSHELAKLVDCPVLCTDKLLEDQIGAPVAKIFENYGEFYFRQNERRLFRQLVGEDTSAVIDAGGGLPCYYETMDYMVRHCIPIYLKVDSETLLNRLSSETDQRPLLKGMDENSLQSYVQRKLSEREIYYSRATHTIDVANKSITEIARQIHQLIVR